MTKSEEIYHRFVQYEWNEIGESMKQSILDAIHYGVVNHEKMTRINIGAKINRMVIELDVCERFDPAYNTLIDDMQEKIDNIWVWW